MCGRDLGWLMVTDGPAPSVNYAKTNHIQNILNLACLTFTLSWALRSSVNEMAVAAMACVDGIPYSASTRVSSLTTGGDGGRGSFKISFITCPIYITTCRETEKWDVQGKIQK